MTDTTIPQTKTVKAANTTLDVILRMVCQNITPSIVGFFCAKLPLIAEATWYEIVVFVLAAAGNAINQYTQDGFWGSISALVLYVRRGFKKIKSATDEPLQ